MIAGVVVDGPVSGAAINCFQADPTGQPTGSAINAGVIMTAVDGSFTLTTATDTTGPLICESTGGLDGGNPASPLSVLMPDDLTGGVSVTSNLTPLTTIATQMVQAGGAATVPVIIQTSADVAAAFGLPAGSNLFTLAPNATGTTTQRKYDQILTDLSAIAVAQGVTMTDVITALVSDLGTDLVLDGLDSGAPIPIGVTTLDQAISALLDTVIEMGFTPDPGPCANDCVSMVRNATKSSAGVLALDITANNITAGNVFGAAFDVTIQDTTVTQWNGLGMMNCTTLLTGCEPGNFLEAHPPVNYGVALQQSTTNDLVVGASEQAGGAGVTGSGTIVTLKFRKVGTVGMTSTLNFANNVLKDPSTNPIDVTWVDGTLTVTF